MTRLVGKRSNSEASIALLFLLLALSAGVLAEYLGYINLVSGFGREGQELQFDRFNDSTVQ